MIQCDCCDRRNNGLSIDPCNCVGNWCKQCLLCSQHCVCLCAEHIVDEEFEPELLSKPLRKLDIDPDDFYPESDEPTVVQG